MKSYNAVSVSPIKYRIVYQHQFHYNIILYAEKTEIELDNLCERYLEIK